MKKIFIIFSLILVLVFVLRYVVRENNNFVKVAKENNNPYYFPDFISINNELKGYKNTEKLDSILFFAQWGDNTNKTGEKDFNQNVRPFLDFSYSHNVTPTITWEPFIKGKSYTVYYTVDSILEGKSDYYIYGWTKALNDWMKMHPGFEVRIRLMHEMNAPIADYQWSHVGPKKYKKVYAYIYNHSVLNNLLKWEISFSNYTADSNWQNKRASGYLEYIPAIDISYIGIDGYSRPYLKGKVGPTGGEVTPEQVLPENFFKTIRGKYPNIKILVSETSIPYMDKTDEFIPYPAGEKVYFVRDVQRAAWIYDLDKYITELNKKYGVYEVTWFNADTDYNWSLEGFPNTKTLMAFDKMVGDFETKGIRVGLFPQ